MKNNNYKNIILTGDLQVGKSTIIDKYIEYLKNNNLSYGGFRTISIKEDDLFNVYIIPATATVTIDKTNNLPRLIYTDFELSDKNKIGDRNKKEFDKSIFDNIGIDILDKDIENKNIIIIDEIGFIETNTKKFIPRIRQLLSDKNKKIVAIFRKHNNNLLDELRNDNQTKIIEVTIDNRNDILNDYLI